jgi:hypothetical protein
MTPEEINELIQKDARNTRVSHNDLARLVSHIGMLSSQNKALIEDNERLRFNEAVMMRTIKQLGGVTPKGLKKQGQCDE